MQVGLYVSVGYANTANSIDRSTASVHAYADNAKITAIEPLDDNNMAVYLDCEPFDTMPIVTDNLTRQIYISSMPRIRVILIALSDIMTGRQSAMLTASTPIVYRAQNTQLARMKSRPTL